MENLNKNMAKPFIIFLILTMVVLFSSGGFIFYNSIGFHIVEYQKKSIGNKLESKIGTLNTFLGDRLNILKDMASFKIVKESIKTMDKKEMGEFFNSMSMVSRESCIELIDYEGNRVFSNKPDFSDFYINKQKIISMLLNGEIKEKVDIVSIANPKGEDYFWALSTPIIKDNHSIGVLKSYYQAKLPLTQGIENEKHEKLVLKKGINFISSTGEISGEAIEVKLNIGHGDISLSLLVEKDKAMSFAQRILNRFLIYFSSGGILIILVIYFLGKRFIFIPGSELQGLNNELKNKNCEINKMKDRFELASKAGNSGVWEWNLKEGFLWWDDKMLELYDLERGEFKFTYEEWKALIHPDDLSIFESGLEQALHNAGAFNQVFKIKDKGEKIRYIASDGRADIDEYGNVVSIIGLNRDVTQEKTAEKNLWEERNLFVAGPTVVLKWEPKDNWPVSYVSPNVKNVLGYTRDELLSGRILYNDILHHEDLNRVKEELQRYIDEGIDFFEQKYRIIKKNGVVIWIYDFTTLVRDEKKNITGINGYIIDVSKSKEDEEKIRVSQERLDLTLKATNSGLWDWNLKTGSIYINNRFAEIIGYSIDELLPMTRKKWEGLCHEDDLAASEKNRKIHFKGKSPFYDCDMRIQHKNGSWIWINDRGMVVQRDEKGEPLRAAGIHMDISERKSLEQGLEKARDEADVANRSKSEFLANMSHEIRTPLNAVIGFSSLLKEIIADERQANYLDSINRSAKSLLVLINDILDLSKIESGRIDLSLEPVNLRVIINEVMDIFSISSSKKGLKLNCEIDENVPGGFYLDEIRFRQILVNIVGNGVKFTHRGGVKIFVSYSSKGGGTGDLLISIADTGIGVAKEYREEIFESFRQKESDMAKEYGGTGLGLAIGKRLANLMDGEIFLESEEGAGSKFTLFLNDVKEAEIPRNISESGEEKEMVKKFKKGSLLVVDDMNTNREIIRESLKSSRVKVFEAENGTIGLIYAREYKPDLILMDLRMPVMDGFETIKELKKDEDLCNIPVVAITASHILTENELKERGFDSQLLKPIIINEFYKVMEKYFEAVDFPAGKESSHLETDPENFLKKDVLRKKLKRIIDEELSLNNKVIDIEGMEKVSLRLLTIGEDYSFRELILFAEQLRSFINLLDVEMIEEHLKKINHIMDILEE